MPLNIPFETIQLKSFHVPKFCLKLFLNKLYDKYMINESHFSVNLENLAVLMFRQTLQALQILNSWNL